MARRTVVTASIAAGLLAAVPGPAAASDETLKAEIESVLVELRPALAEFQDAAQGLPQAKDTTRLQEATEGFRTGLSRYRWGVVNRKASSPDGLAAKKQLLTAIRQFDIGLVQYESALEKLDAGGRRTAILASLRTADRRFTEGAQDEADALTALGVAPEG